MPSPGPGEVRVDVAFVGVNFADVVMCRGFYKAAPRPPFVPGFEVSGTVGAVGAGVARVKEGDRVLAATRFGGYTTHLVVPERQVWAVPTDVGLAEAAAIPVAYATAWVALTDVARVRAGESVLVHAVAGGLGTATVQLGKYLGLTVIGTASTDEKLAFARQQGVDVGINYAKEDFLPAVMKATGGRGVDVCVDSVAGAILERSYQSLAPGGRLVIVGAADLWPSSMLGWVRTAWQAATQRRFTPFDLIDHNRGVAGLQLLLRWTELWERLGKPEGDFDRLIDLFGQRVLRAVVDREFPLAEAGEAHRYLEGRKTKGKVVLRASA